MSDTNPTTETVSERENENVQKRANYEAFDFAVCGDGEHVNVRNTSYGDDSNSHIYTVTIENGTVQSCTCPDHKYRERTCKHMTATENNTTVMNATSSAVTQALTDGGTDDSDGGSDDSDQCRTDEHTSYCPQCAVAVTGDYNHRTGRFECPYCGGAIEDSNEDTDDTNDTTADTDTVADTTADTTSERTTTVEDTTREDTAKADIHHTDDGDVSKVGDGWYTIDKGEIGVITTTSLTVEDIEDMSHAERVDMWPEIYATDTAQAWLEQKVSSMLSETDDSDTWFEYCFIEELQREMATNDTASERTTTIEDILETEKKREDTNQ